jgi:hypothetical protein
MVCSSACQLVHGRARAPGLYPEAAQTSERIRDQVQARYGIDVNNTGADEASVSAALTRAQQTRTEAKMNGPRPQLHVQMKQ